MLLHDLSFSLCLPVIYLLHCMHCFWVGLHQKLRPMELAGMYQHQIDNQRCTQLTLQEIASPAPGTTRPRRPERSPDLCRACFRRCNMYKEPTITHAWIIHINQSPDLRSIPQFLSLCLHASVCTSVQAYPELYHHKGDIKVLWRIGYIKLMSVSITTTKRNQEYYYVVCICMVVWKVIECNSPILSTTSNFEHAIPSLMNTWCVFGVHS